MRSHSPLGDRHRLLAEHVHAGARRALGEDAVLVVRHREVHGLDRLARAALLELVVVVGGHSVALAELATLHGVSGDDRREPGSRPRVRECGQHRDLCDVPESDHRVAHRLARGDPHPLFGHRLPAKQLPCRAPVVPIGAARGRVGDARMGL
jgi:hypothetical protein